MPPCRRSTIASTGFATLAAQHANPEQSDRIARFNNLIGKKLAELEATLALYEKGGREAAFELISTGIGLRTMDADPHGGGRDGERPLAGRFRRQRPLDA